MKLDKLLCSQCGTCAGTCPTNAIEMERDINGNYFPLINKTLCTDCNTCIESCPGFSIDFKLLNMSIFNKSPDDNLLGNYMGCYAGYTTDNEVLKNASSGGIISSLLIYALEKGIINGAVVTKLSEKDSLRPEIIIARSKEEILSAAQSKYIPVPVNVAIREILRENGKFAVVGLPCHIHGMRKAEQLNVKLKDKVVLRIGLICGHTDNIQATYLHLRRKGIPIDELERIEYRAGNWPGEVCAKLKNGTIKSVEFRKSDFKHLHTCGFFMPLHCTVCSDATNELADISVGDAWLPEFEKLDHGISVIISRTQEGDNILKDIAREGRIKLMDLDPIKIKQSQLYQLSFKKKSIVARMSILRLIGKDIPIINTDFLKPTIIDHLGAIFLYLNIHLASKRFSKGVLAHIPSFLLSAYSKMTKILTGMPPVHVYLHLRGHTRIKNKTITVLGSYHGHNAGDNAILASIVSEFKKRSPNIEFNVLSGRPWLLEGKFDVNPISTRPSNLSLNMLGLPAFRSIYNSDIVIITQAILFDSKLFNLAYNYLFALFFLVPFAKMLEKPVICYNVGVGPLNTKLGKFLARNILNRVDFIILRQEDSQELLKELGVTRPQLSLGADPALNNVPVEQVKASDILQELGVNHGSIIGVNVHGYIDKLIRESKDQISKLEFTNIMSKFCDEIIEKLGVNVVFVITNYRYDEKITKEIRDKMRHKNKTAILNNREYTHNEIMGVLGQMDMFVGMRLHSIILAAAMYTPVVGVVYLPKVRDFMRRIGQEDKAIEFDEFSVEMLLSKVENTWHTRETIREQLKKEISELKKKVSQSTELALNYLQHQ